MKKLSNSMKRRLAVERAAYTVTIRFGMKSSEQKPVTYKFAMPEELRAFVRGVNEAAGWNDYEIVKVKPTLFEAEKP